jgi:alkyl hydroperoxide reductase subunit AhpC
VFNVGRDGRWSARSIHSLRSTLRRHICDFNQVKVEIISVSLDGGETTDSTLRDLKGLLANHPVDWPVIFDDTGWDNPIAQSYGVNRLPTYVVIDRDGIIRSIAEGAKKKKGLMRRICALAPDLNC